jgi:predicted phage tail protein
MSIIGSGGGGGKGGGGSGRVAQEAPDSLRSKAFAKVLDLISEGEIEGLVDGAKSIYLDDTPLQNRDGSYNFTGATWSTRNGTQSQGYIPGFSAVENTTSVGVEVLKNTSVTRQFTNPNINYVRVTLGFPGLVSQNPSNGDTSGTSVSIRIDVQSNGGGFVSQTLSQQTVAASVSGNTAAATAFKLRANLTVTAGVEYFNDPNSDYNPSLRNVWPTVRAEYRLNGGAWTTISETVEGGAWANSIFSNSTTVTYETPSLSSQQNIELRATVTSGANTGSVQMTSAEAVILANFDTISGKTTSRYQRTYTIPVSGTGPWDVRVVRLTDDSTSQTLQNKTFWDAATEVIDTKLRYPNSALIGLQCDASQFNSIPRRAYDIRGLKVRVPVNYNPLTRAYTGSWDGTFKTAWTDNPAWCLYDLLTTERYGLGAFINTTQVDKWALYAIGRYCDQMVPNGFGSQEPRFTCNLYLQSQQEAYQVIQDMASIFRGMAFWSSGSITAVQDSPATAAYLYTAANVIDGVFTYSGSSAKARHTVALVAWNDPADMYRQKVEYVEDAEGIARYGVITTNIAAIGCTSRGQAHRAGRWLLFSERLETETVTFKTGIEGMICRPGQIIKVADPARAGLRYGGRIVSATTSSVQIDSPITLVAGQSYTLSALKADGTVMETTVSHSGGTLSTLSLSPALSEAPAVSSVWMLTSTAVNPQTFRVIAVVENDRNEFEVTALAHEPSKYGAIENGFALEQRSISILTATPATPENLTVTDSLYRSSSGVLVRMSVSWSPVVTATSYAVVLQRQGGNSEPEIISTTPSVDVDVTEGLYTVRVVAINAIGKRSTNAATATYQVVGKTSPPENVQNFVVARNGTILNFTWRPVGDVDFDHYELRQGLSWNTGIPIGSTSSNAFSWSAPRGGTFMIKAVDTSGNFSAVESLVSVPDISGINVVLASDETTNGWNGTTNNAYATPGGVVINGTQPWSAYTQPWNSYTSAWMFLDPVSSGTYTTQPIDIGFVATSTVHLENIVQTIQQVGVWNDFTEPWSYYSAPEWSWQGRISGISASFDISTSNDNITWSAWQQFTPGAYTFRYVRIRATLATDDLVIIPYLTSLIVRIDVPDRVLHFGNVSIPIAGATLTFSPAFVGVQTVQVTLQSATSGDRFTVTGKSNSQVTVNVFDGAGSAKAGTVDVDVFGYGERF